MHRTPSSPGCRAGEAVLALGFGALGRACGPSVTGGVLSAVVGAPPVMLQSTCAVHAGSSGGPLLAASNGRLLGKAPFPLSPPVPLLTCPPPLVTSRPLPIQGSWPATRGTTRRGPPTPTSTSASPSPCCSPPSPDTSAPGTPLPSPRSMQGTRGHWQPGGCSSGPPASCDPPHPPKKYWGAVSIKTVTQALVSPGALCKQTGGGGRV